MKKTVVIILTVVLGLVAGAAIDESLMTGLFRASFTEQDLYAPGESLSTDKGTSGGSWGDPPVPENAEAVVVAESGLQYLRCSTLAPGIVFTPKVFGDRKIKSLVMSMRMTGFDELPALEPSDKAAFALYSPQGGETTFAGWTADGWTNLYLRGDATSVVGNDWCDLMIRLAEYVDGSTKVQYCLDVDGTFVTLTNTLGATWFDAGWGKAGEVVNEVEFRGDGGLVYLNGQEPRRGMLISVVPWRMLTEETVTRHDTGSWPAPVEVDGKWVWGDARPAASDDGRAYVIDVSSRDDAKTFVPKKNSAEDFRSVEFAVRFESPHDGGMLAEDVAAMVRVVMEPLTDFSQAEPVCRFAYLTGDGWVVNEEMVAYPENDYTVKVELDPQAGTVNYSIRNGRGAEGGVYRSLGGGRTTVGDPLQTIFGGHGRVYGIKAVTQTPKK